MNQQIYTVMKQLYSKYTGEEIAEVIRAVRRELTDQQELKAIEEQEQKLKEAKKRIKSKIDNE